MLDMWYQTRQAQVGGKGWLTDGCGERSMRTALDGVDDVAVHPAKPPVADEVVDEVAGPVPRPGEPVPQLSLGRDDRCAYPRGNEVGERAAGVTVGSASSLIGLVPARQLTRMRVPFAGGDRQRPRDDRAVSLQRRPHRLELMPGQPELGAQVFGAGWPSR